jgi:hypothetical protein
MSDAKVYYESDRLCPNEACGHPVGWHGADTAGCSSIGVGGWCSCAVIHPDHPEVIEDSGDDHWDCGVCRRPLEVRVIHADEPVLHDGCDCTGPAGWHCPGEESQHWTIGDDPDGECGHCGMRPSDAA